MAMDRQAFDEWLPHIGKYVPGTGDFDDPEELRKDVLERVLARDGVAGILRLACMVKLPNLIGSALRHTSITLDQLFELLTGALDPAAPRELAFFVSAVGAEKFGDQWKAAFSDRALYEVQDDSVKAHLLLGWSLDEATWSFVDSLGGQVREQYWRQLRALPIQGTLDQLLFAIDQLRRQGRDLEVLGLVHLRLKDLPTVLIQSLLAEGIRQIPSVINSLDNMLSYYVAGALAEMRKRDNANELDIAKLEYAYLPILRDEKEPLTIIGLMARDPELFIDVLSHVFKGKNAPPNDEVTDEEKSRARTSYDLLSTFRTVPGFADGKIDITVLAAWVAEARKAAKAKDLAEISDLYIGYVLAHAPMDTEELFWPHSAVCSVIEAVASNDIERGISTECFNKRGTYGKSINEGGGQERALADQYQGWANSTHRYPRTSAMLTGIADMWRHHADREDTRAEKNKLKM